MFSEIGAPFWDERPVAIIGGGPSLRGVALERIEGLAHVLAVKGAIFDHPFAELGFGLDSATLTLWWERLDHVRFPVFWAVGERWRPPKPTRPRSIRLLGRDSRADLSTSPRIICGGGTSGFGALNLAVLKRARFVVLFGYDYGPGQSETGRAPLWHANEAHYAPGRAQHDSCWRDWAKNFDAVAPTLATAGVRVINASPESRINAFPRCTPDEGIARIEAWWADRPQSGPE